MPEACPDEGQGRSGSEGTSAREERRRGLAPGEPLPLGRTSATSLALLKVPPGEILKAFRRHAQHDWGEVGDFDRAANDKALVDGERVLSIFRSQEGVEFWVITNEDRSGTIALLPKEY